MIELLCVISHDGEKLSATSWCNIYIYTHLNKDMHAKASLPSLLLPLFKIMKVYV